MIDARTLFCVRTPVYNAVTAYYGQVLGFEDLSKQSNNILSGRVGASTPNGQVTITRIVVKCLQRVIVNPHWPTSDGQSPNGQFSAWEHGVSIWAPQHAPFLRLLCSSYEMQDSKWRCHTQLSAPRDRHHRTTCIQFTELMDLPI